VPPEAVELVEYGGAEFPDVGDRIVCETSKISYDSKPLRPGSARERTPGRGAFEVLGRGRGRPEPVESCRACRHRVARPAETRR
jgi:hypothetical protein